MKRITIKITITNGKITLDGQNLSGLTEADLVESTKSLVSLAKILNITGEGDPTDENA